MDKDEGDRGESGNKEGDTEQKKKTYKTIKQTGKRRNKESGAYGEIVGSKAIRERDGDGAVIRLTRGSRGSGFYDCDFWQINNSKKEGRGGGRAERGLGRSHKE